MNQLNVRRQVAATLRGSQVSAAPWLGGVLDHVHAEYEEMPGLCLTLAQAQRLWGIDADSCRVAITQLVEAGYLRLSPHGYVRA